MTAGYVATKAQKNVFNPISTVAVKWNDIPKARSSNE